MGYTKGEWKAETTLYPVTIWAIDGKGRECQIAELNTMSDNTEEANARLIAAAPRMYEALEAMNSGSYLNPSNPNRVWDRATPSEAAIIKAFQALAAAEERE